MIDAGGSSSSDVQPTASAMATVAKCRTRCPSQKRVRFPTLLKSNQDEIELRSITTRCPSHATRAHRRRRAVARVGSLTEWPRSRESLAVDNAEVDELAPEIELHRAAEEVAPDCRARLDRPLGVDRARDPELERAAVFVLDVREQLRLQIAADDQAVEVLVDLEDAEQRRVDPAGQGG